jgi:hypothetical protein
MTDPHPLAVRSGKYLSGSTPVASAKDGTYSKIKVHLFSSSTRLRLIVVEQHGSFGGPGLDRDQFYCAGSEDSRSYI